MSMLERIADAYEAETLKRNAATARTKLPNGGYLIYISPRETDVIGQLLRHTVEIETDKQRG